MGKLSIIEKRAGVGLAIELNCSSLGKKIGTIKEILAEERCLVLSSADGEECYIDESEITSFTFLAKVTADKVSDENIKGCDNVAEGVVVSESQTDTSHRSCERDEGREIAGEISKGQCSSPTKVLHVLTQKTGMEDKKQDSVNTYDRDLEDQTKLFFSVMPSIEMPKPVFDINECLSPNQQVRYDVRRKIESLIIKWKNKYDNASKVREWSRLADVIRDVKASARLYKLPYFGYSRNNYFFDASRDLYNIPRIRSK